MSFDVGHSWSYRDWCKAGSFIAGKFVILSLLGYKVTISLAHGAPITYAGFQWEALGQAQLSITSNGLQVSNVGQTGNDGVRLLLPNGIGPTDTQDWAISDSGLGAPGSPVGAFLQMTPLGTINGTPGQSIDNLTMTTMSGGGVSLAVDMAPIAAASMTAYYYNNGALVLTETGLPSVGYVIPHMQTPDTWGPIDHMGEDFDYNNSIAFPTFAGGTVTSDDVVFEPVGSGITFGGYSAVDYTGSGIGGFNIAPVPEPSSGGLLFLGALLLWSASQSRNAKAVALSALAWLINRRDTSSSLSESACHGVR